MCRDGQILQRCHEWINKLSWIISVRARIIIQKPTMSNNCAEEEAVSSGFHQLSVTSEYSNFQTKYNFFWKIVLLFSICIHSTFNLSCIYIHIFKYLIIKMFLFFFCSWDSNIEEFIVLEAKSVHRIFSGREKSS